MDAPALIPVNWAFDSSVIETVSSLSHSVFEADAYRCHWHTEFLVGVFYVMPQLVAQFRQRVFVPAHQLMRLKRWFHQPEQRFAACGNLVDGWP